MTMPNFYQPDLGANPNDPFARDADSKLVRRSYWLDMMDQAIVLIFAQGIGIHLSNDQKRDHLADIKREHLVDAVCPIDILPPED